MQGQMQGPPPLRLKKQQKQQHDEADDEAEQRADAGGMDASDDGAAGSSSARKPSLRAVAAAQADNTLVIAHMREQMDQMVKMISQMQAQQQMQMVQQQAQMAQQRAHESAASAVAPAASAQEEESMARGGHEEEQQDNRSYTSNGSGAQYEVVARKLLRVREPEELRYAKAGTVVELESWIDNMVRLFRQVPELMPEDNHEGRLREFHNYSDRDMQRWWSDMRAAAKAENRSIDTWPQLVETLRAQFQPKRARQQAIEDLFAVRQNAGETVDAYFMRAALLFSRAEGFNNESAMLLVLDRVRKDEWPQTYAAAMEKVIAKEIVELSQLRAFMQIKALAEPKRHSAPAVQQQRAASSSSNMNKAQKLRAAAALLEAAEEDDGTDDGAPGGPLQTAPLKRRPKAPSNWCVRCKESGHTVEKCSKPDTRECFTCKETGHIARSCPKNKDGAKSKKG